MSEKKKRWSVREVKEFCGWDFIEMMVKAGATARDRALVASAFLTGGRISEVLQLKRRHFLLDNDASYIIVRSMPRVKCYRKVKSVVKWKCVSHCKMRWDDPPSDKAWEHHGELEEYVGWITRPIEEYRTFPINKTEPGVEELVKYVTPLPDPDTLLIPIRYERAYHILTSLGKKFEVHTPPHWFRAQRASQLAFEYGFSEHDLVEFFKWKNYATAFHYASKGYKGLAAKMVR